MVGKPSLARSFFETVATMDLRAPGVRDQSTPVNRYTTGGFSVSFGFSC